MGTPKPVRRLERVRHCCGNSQTLSSIVEKRRFRIVKFIDIIVLRPLSIRMTSLKDVRNQLLISHNEGVGNNDELLLLYDLNRSNISTYLIIPFPILTSMIWETTSACPNFASTNATCPQSR